MRKMKFMAIMMMAVIVMSVYSACGDNDDNGSGLGLSDTEVTALLQGTWDVTHNGKTQVWVFSGNTVKGVYGSNLSSSFSVSDGVLTGNVFEGGIVITKLTNTSFEAYYKEDSSERYSGTKRQ